MKKEITFLQSSIKAEIVLFRKTHIDGKTIYGIVKDQGGNKKLGYVCHLGSGEGRTLEGKRMGKMYIDTSIISQVEVSSYVSLSLLCIFKMFII